MGAAFAAGSEDGFESAAGRFIGKMAVRAEDARDEVRSSAARAFQFFVVIEFQSENVAIGRMDKVVLREMAEIRQVGEFVFTTRRRSMEEDEAEGVFAVVREGERFHEGSRGDQKGAAIIEFDAARLAQGEEVFFGAEGASMGVVQKESDVVVCEHAEGGRCKMIAVDVSQESGSQGGCVLRWVGNVVGALRGGMLPGMMEAHARLPDASDESVDAQTKVDDVSRVALADDCAIAC